jgi:DNA-binding HxlR family transcriptional regulator
MKIMSTTEVERLIALGRHRWLPQLLAELGRSRGARFVELIHRLEISRESLSRTLESAIAMGWLMKNPGHGHPLRPEYILTETGIAIARQCERILLAEASIGIAPAAMNRWSRPILHVIGTGEQRYSGIARRLPGSNPRALTQSIKSLVEKRLVQRTIVAQYPPVAEYRLLPAGATVAAALSH